VLPHSAQRLGPHLRHGELAAPFDDGQTLGYWLPGLGRRPQLRQVRIAALEASSKEHTAGL